MNKHTFNAEQYEANIAALPELCFAKSIMDDTIVVIKRAETGYYPVDEDKWPRFIGETPEQQARRLNDKLGVTTAQRMAMLLGSMAGFDVPGAHPEAHLKGALLEDLHWAAPELGREADTMAANGASYEDIRNRFKASYDEATQTREPAVC